MSFFILNAIFILFSILYIIFILDYFFSYL